MIVSVCGLCVDSVKENTEQCTSETEQLDVSAESDTCSSSTSPQAPRRNRRDSSFIGIIPRPAGKDRTEIKRGRQCTYRVTLRRVRAIIVAVEKQ